MRFSIVTPVFNAEKYLDEMLDSVINQTFTDWELCIVDDGSTDSCREIIEKRAVLDGRIKPTFLKDNSGSCFLPRRHAIGVSAGDYIVNIDADDIVESDYLAKLDKRISDTGATLIYADMYLLKENQAAEKIIPVERDHVYDTVYEGRTIFRRSLGDWNVSGVAATERELAVQSLELFDREMMSPREWNSFDNENLTRLDLFLARKVAFAEAAYYYRQVPQSVTHRISERRFGLLNADMVLNDFVVRNFSRHSEEYVLVQRQLFHHVVEFIRLLNRHPYLTDSTEDLVREAFRHIDMAALKGKVSPRYRALLKRGFWISKLILSIYGGREG